MSWKIAQNDDQANLVFPRHLIIADLRPEYDCYSEGRGSLIAWLAVEDRAAVVGRFCWPLLVYVVLLCLTVPSARNRAARGISVVAFVGILISLAGPHVYRFVYPPSTDYVDDYVYFNRTHEEWEGATAAKGGLVVAHSKRPQRGRWIVGFCDGRVMSFSSKQFRVLAEEQGFEVPP